MRFAVLPLSYKMHNLDSAVPERFNLRHSLGLGCETYLESLVPVDRFRYEYADVSPASQLLCAPWRSPAALQLTGPSTFVAAHRVTHSLLALSSELQQPSLISPLSDAGRRARAQGSHNNREARGRN